MMNTAGCEEWIVLGFGVLRLVAAFPVFNLLNIDNVKIKVNCLGKQDLIEKCQAIKAAGLL